MKAPSRAGIALAFCACVAGCAGTGSVTTIPAVSTRNAITVGQSTKADVLAALGKTTAVSFDSGFEVWVYQFKSDVAAKQGVAERFGFAGSDKEKPGITEFVILFAPSGVVTKTRIRVPPPPGESKGT
jgi:hypothetical protein